MADGKGAEREVERGGLRGTEGDEDRRGKGEGERCRREGAMKLCRHLLLESRWQMCAKQMSWRDNDKRNHRPAIVPSLSLSLSPSHYRQLSTAFCHLRQLFKMVMVAMVPWWEEDNSNCAIFHGFVFLGCDSLRLPALRTLEEEWKKKLLSWMLTLFGVITSLGWRVDWMGVCFIHDL